jgi:hypothetical protein
MAAPKKTPAAKSAAKPAAKPAPGKKAPAKADSKNQPPAGMEQRSARARFSRKEK